MLKVKSAKTNPLNAANSRIFSRRRYSLLPPHDSFGGSGPAQFMRSLRSMNCDGSMRVRFRDAALPRTRTNPPMSLVPSRNEGKKPIATIANDGFLNTARRTSSAAREPKDHMNEPIRSLFLRLTITAPPPLPSATSRPARRPASPWYTDRPGCRGRTDTRRPARPRRRRPATPPPACRCRAGARPR
jgi:hypothetical protein